MHQTEIDDSIGLAYYKVDIHPCRLGRGTVPWARLAKQVQLLIQTPGGAAGRRSTGKRRLGKVPKR